MAVPSHQSWFNLFLFVVMLLRGVSWPLSVMSTRHLSHYSHVFNLVPSILLVHSLENMTSLSNMRSYATTRPGLCTRAPVGEPNTLPWQRYSMRQPMTYRSGKRWGTCVQRGMDGSEESCDAWLLYGVIHRPLMCQDWQQTACVTVRNIRALLRSIAVVMGNSHKCFSYMATAANKELSANVAASSIIRGAATEAYFVRLRD